MSLFPVRSSRLADGLGVRHVILLALHKRLHIGRRDQPQLMPQLANVPAPEVSAATGFHRHDARGQLAEKLQHLPSPCLFAQNGSSCAVSSMHLEYILRKIEPADMTRPLCGSLQTHLGTSDAVGGGHIIRAFHRSLPIRIIRINLKLCRRI